MCVNLPQEYKQTRTATLSNILPVMAASLFADVQRRYVNEGMKFSC